MIIKITSAGQTGAERAALDVALENDIACGGWCANGRQVEDGPLDPRYPLVEIESASQSRLIEANVRDAEGTLLLSWGPMGPGAVKTAAIAARLKRPLLMLDMTDASDRVEKVIAWATRFNLRVLHVTGSRASEVPQAYAQAKQLLLAVLVEPAAGAEPPAE
jgi:hypothetical protein